ncbi:MAG: hypothetical protein PUF60_08460 [Firmicutes bacterium]|nr:hypothetical protein [Bacillota bacterium]
MKRIALIVVSIIFAIILFSCTYSSESQYDENTNQHISAFGISLQIPKVWDEKIEGEDSLQYYDGKDGRFDHGISITVEKEEVFDEAVERLKENLELSKKQYHNTTDIVFKEDHVSDTPAVIAEYTGISDNKKYEYMTVVFQSEQNVIEIDYFSIDQQGIDDFQKVLDSISFEEEKKNPR